CLERLRIDHLDVAQPQRPHRPAVENLPDPMPRNTKPRRNPRRAPAADEEQQYDPPLRVRRWTFQQGWNLRWNRNRVATDCASESLAAGVNGRNRPLLSDQQNVPLLIPRHVHTEV